MEFACDPHLRGWYTLQTSWWKYKHCPQTEQMRNNILHNKKGHNSYQLNHSNTCGVPGSGDTDNNLWSLHLKANCWRILNWNQFYLLIKSIGIHWAPTVYTKPRAIHYNHWRLPRKAGSYQQGEASGQKIALSLPNPYERVLNTAPRPLRLLSQQS